MPECWLRRWWQRQGGEPRGRRACSWQRGAGLANAGPGHLGIAVHAMWSAGVEAPPGCSCHVLWAEAQASVSRGRAAAEPILLNEGVFAASQAPLRGLPSETEAPPGGVGSLLFTACFLSTMGLSVADRAACLWSKGSFPLPKHPDFLSQ